MDTFRSFITRYPKRTYKKGEMILLRSEVPSSVHVIETGIVKTYSITKNGSERLVSIDANYEDFPIGYVDGIVATSEYFHEAFSDCTIRLIPREEYRNYLNSDIQRIQSQYHRVMKLLLGTLLHIHALEQSTAGEKIAYLLVYMGRQFGVPVRPGSHDYKIIVTQQEIANALGIARETTSLELKKLEKLDLITHSRNSYVVDMPRMREHLDIPIQS